MRTDLVTWCASLATVAFACSGTSSPSGLGNGGSSGSGGSSSSGGSSGAMTDDASAAGSSSSGSGSSSGSTMVSGSSSSSGSGSTTSSGAIDGGGNGASDASTADAAYPSGPYCSPASGNPPHIAAGCVLPNREWIGYDDEAANAVATTEPYAAYTLADAFKDARKSGKRYAMLNLAEFDCPGCQKSAGELGAVDGGVSAGAAVVQAGGVVIELLETRGFMDVASQSDLESWINKYSLTVTTVVDPGKSGTPSPSLAFFGQREQAYIIDLTTMKILQYINGDISGLGATSGGLAMTAMLKLLK